MIIEKIIEFKLKGSGSPGRTYTFITAYFRDKPKTYKENLIGLLFTAKIFDWWYRI